MSMNMNGFVCQANTTQNLIGRKIVYIFLIADVCLCFFLLSCFFFKFFLLIQLFEDRPIHLAHPKECNTMRYFHRVCNFSFHFCALTRLCFLFQQHERKEKTTTTGTHVYFLLPLHRCVFSLIPFCRRRSGRVLLNFIVVCGTE